MKNDVFSINNFSIIEDDENYYFFRALEPYDLTDEQTGKIEKTNKEYTKLRTYRERYNETHSIPSRYKEDSKISLDEVYSHIKKNFYPGTNCISFSTNCNVSLDYGYGFDKYVMIKVPKSGSPNVYSGGQYMLEELDKYLENVIAKLVNQNDIISIIRNLEQATSNEEIIRIINKQVNNYSYIQNGENLISRFLPKQFFNSQQQLAYNKIIGKLTLLEISGNIKNILSRTKGNTSLISTISMAYSSGEIINYGNEFSGEIQSISKTSIDLFALLQQAEDMGLDRIKVDKLKRRVLQCAKQGFELRQYNGTLGYGNDNQYISFTPTLNSILINEHNLPLNKEILIDDTFRLTDGSISYNKAKNAVEFALNLGLAKEKTYELCELLKSISSDLDVNDIINQIASRCYSVNGRIINRRNMSGLKICESVNIDMNLTREKIYSDEEQIRMISYIERMSRDNLRNLLWSNGLSIEKNLCQNILLADNKRGINRYYAETIVEQINFENIYGEDRVVSDQEKQLLISKIEEADCVNLYNCLKKCGLSDELISGCVVNFFIDNGFKEYNFVELSNLEDLEIVLKSNLKNINYKIPAIRLDKVLGISDNDNIIEGTEINLRDYQQDAINNIESLFEEKRFSGVILPTGAGKSFVAMAEMLKYRNKNILYYAPNTEILNQITKHIMKNILHLSNEEIQRLYDEKSPIPNGKFLPSNIETVIKEAFPHLKLYCYQGLTTKDDQFFESHDADLIVFDELHRAGATEWNNKIKKLVKSNPNAKLLGITATPIRDVDRQDMMLKFAELSGDYSKTELIQKKYLASEMYLIDAMQDGFVVVPNLVSFDYSLENSDQYKEIKTMYETEKDPVEKARLKEIYDEMRSIVENAQKKGMPSIIKEAFEKNKKRKNGRYIVFLPIKSDSNISTEQYVQDEIEKVKEYFSLIDENPEIGYLLSNRQDLSKNAKSMSNFEKESDHLKLIFAINMLNEGVHVDGIDGIVMLRPIGANTKILYSQQTGRCVYSLDPKNPIKDENIPLIFDVYNNYLEQNMDREVNKSNSTSDLQKMRLATYWVRKHRGYFPDINSEDVVEYRKALTLKKIQIKYSKFLDESFGDNLTPTEQYEIEEILMLGKTINLWDRVIPNRDNIETSEKSVERINTFKATGETKRFLDLCKKAKENSKSNVKVGSLRIRTAVSTLELLSEYGMSINNDTISTDSLLKDVIKTIPPELLTIIKSEMEELQISEDYPIGIEYNFVKQMFCTKNPTFLEFSIRTLRSAGIFHEFENNKGNIVSPIDSRGFIIKGRPEYRKVNIYTGSYYDADGLDVDGYDELHFKDGGGTYNKYGFDRDGIHIKTKTKLDIHGFDIYGNYYSQKSDGSYENKGKYDDYGFDINGLWYELKTNKKTGKTDRVYTGKSIDADGYTIDGINQKNFGRDGFYYIKNENDEYINTGRTRNDYGFDCEEIHENGTKYDNYGFDINGMHLNGTLRDDYGFDRDGFAKLYSFSNETSRYINGFDRDGINSETGFKYNLRGFDRDGYYWKPSDGATREKTEEKYNEEGFDINKLHKITKMNFNENGKDEQGNIVPNRPNGFHDRDGVYWEEQEDGKYIKTTSIYDKYGFDKNGLNRNGTRYDDHGFDINGYHRDTSDKIDNKEYGFDRDGYYWEISGYKRVRIDSPIDKYQFDRDGYYWEELADGSFQKTDNKYDKRGFNKFRIHNVTGRDFDEYGMAIDGKVSSFLIKNRFFDNDGFYFQKQSDGKLVKTDSKYNDQGFYKSGIHKDTNQPWNEYGLDVNGTLSLIKKRKFFGLDGYYWQKLSDGTFQRTDSKYNERGFDERGKHKDTKLTIDSFGRDDQGSTFLLDLSQGFDDNGYYWVKQQDGTYQKTNNKFKENQFDKNGYYWEEQEDGTFKNTYRKTDKYGFNTNGEYDGLEASEIKKKTKTKSAVKSKYNNRGFDVNGNHKNGTRFDDNGFDRDGNHENGTRYDDNGFDVNRLYKNGNVYDDNGFDYRGIHKETNKPFDKNGNNRYNQFIGFEYDKYGFDINGNNKNGTRFDSHGFDKDGIHSVTHTEYDENGYDKNGINKDTKTILSFDRYDQDGYFHKSDRDDEKCYLFDVHGFDRDGYYWDKQEDGTYIKTDRKFDSNGFGKDGYYWQILEDGTYMKTNNTINSHGIDVFGFDMNGIHSVTGLEYDEHCFKKDGTNIYTKQKYDFNGFDINGIHMNSKAYCNNLGFDRDGIHSITNTKYDEHGLDIYRNKPFDLESGKDLPYEVYIIKKYLDGRYLLKGNSKDFLQLLSKRYNLKTVAQFEETIGKIMIKAFQMCPELKRLFSRQLLELSMAVAKRKSELKKINNTISENKVRIEQLKREISFYEGRISKFSSYK